MHTLGPTCAYHEDEPDTVLPEGSAPPPVKAQFFYVSSLPIDDPLSPLPPIQTDRAHKHPPQPFSTRDNAALEEAWQGFQQSQDPGKDSSSRPSLGGIFTFPRFKEGVKSSSAPSPSANPSVDSLSPDQERAAQITEEYNKLPQAPVVNADASQGKKPTTNSAKPSELNRHGANERSTSARPSMPEPDQVARVRDAWKQKDQMAVSDSQVMLGQSLLEDRARAAPVNYEELQCKGRFEHSPPSAHRRRSSLSPFRREVKERLARGSTSRDFGSAAGAEGNQVVAQVSSSGMSGRPFARAPSKRNITGASTDGAVDIQMSSDASDGDSGDSQSQHQNRPKKSKQVSSTAIDKVYVPVGTARLHLVEVPDLVMNPIYWSPINDTSDVIRATWFYKDTMLPLAAEVANRLEIGYEYIKPYSESFQDELHACIDNGASAELRIVHKLWPEEKNVSRPSTGDTRLSNGSEEDDEPSLPNEHTNTAIDPSKQPQKHLFRTHSVIYSDRRNAQILKPSLLPSVRHNRRPLGAIRKGRQIGVAVVRGFDRNAWLKLHPPKKMTDRKAHAQVGAYMSQSGDATTKARRMSCATCDNESQAPSVSDLVLVVHGIGQKLSERVDSYHFTHAINGLRREFNVELSSESVKGNLKPNSGIMVLPVNWRLTVSFDEDMKSSNSDENNTNKYKLDDITPDTLPAVRSVISDVMLDIPYYLSHHKDKMTSAVVREANRIYRLWCRNNPGFQEHGRVHLVAHSLGSVMAMEILSKQPTSIPKNLKLGTSTPSEKMFEFDTTNLFCCGSPAGFFLLLNNARLVPRKGRDKPGMEGEDHGDQVAAEEGYGCLAIDNLYNICHRNDPIAYLVNAAVDSGYAASLQPVHIPNAQSGLFSRLWSSSSASDAYSTKEAAKRPTVQHMPSTVEMETHNFTREDIAEKRMYLLNENGQIDYYLSSSGGPLEIQYLSMLSAHSSYWLSRDFVRFLVIEIGRKRGKENTMEVLRAKKKREWKRGEMK